MSIQDLKSQVSTLQSTSSKTDSELKRLTKTHALLVSQSDAHKTESLRLNTLLGELKNKHETDLAQMRKQTAGLQRDKSDLQAAMEKAQKMASRLNVSPSNGTPRKGRGGRFSSGGPNQTPTRNWRDVGNEDEGDEVDEWGVGGAGGGSTRRRGPGFDNSGNVMSPGFRSVSFSPLHPPVRGTFMLTDLNASLVPPQQRLYRLPCCLS